LIQSAKMAAVGKLAAGVAHELNNPLMIIDGFVMDIKQSLVDENWDIEELMDNIERILAAVNRMASLIHTMKNFSRDSKADFATFDVNSAVDNVMLLSKKTISKKSIEVDTKLCEGEPKVYGHSNQIGQVLLNLVGNAADAMENSGIAREAY